MLNNKITLIEKIVFIDNLDDIAIIEKPINLNYAPIPVIKFLPE